jgi:hypothetical protein
MEAVVAQIVTVGLTIYIAWMLWSKRTMWYGRRDDPHFVPPNGRWVFKEDEPGLYWAAVAFHGVILALMVYGAFFG